MFSMQYIGVVSALIMVTVTNQAVTDNPFCTNVANDWNEMKTIIASLASEAHSISQLVTDVASFKSRLDILETKGQ